MAELENDEVNRKQCQMVVEDMFESWLSETQEALVGGTTSDQLKQHEKIHQEKCYACQKCGKGFGRRVCK